MPIVKKTSGVVICVAIGAVMICGTMRSPVSGDEADSARANSIRYWKNDATS